jgi:hypothetical protein
MPAAGSCDVKRFFNGDIALGFVWGFATLLFGIVISASIGFSLPSQATIDYMDKNEGFFVGTFTFALFVATFFLWQSTSKLWRASERQLNLSERSLNELERPWLFLSSVSIRWRSRAPDGPLIFNNWFAKIHWKNIGRSPAIVESCVFAIVDKSRLPAIPAYSPGMELSVQHTIAAAETVESSEVGPSPGRDEHLIFYGRIVYRELGGKTHETGFAIEMSHVMPAYVSHNNREYNYFT